MLQHVIFEARQGILGKYEVSTVKRFILKSQGILPVLILNYFICSYKVDKHV